MKTLTLATILMLASFAQARTVQVICQAPANQQTAYTFSGSGTVTMGEENIASKKQDLDIRATTAQMSLTLSGPEGSSSPKDGYVGEGETSIIEEGDLMRLDAYYVEVSSTSVAEDLKMLLDGPMNLATSKFITGGKIYWANCQIQK